MIRHRHHRLVVHQGNELRQIHCLPCLLQASNIRSSALNFLVVASSAFVSFSMLLPFLSCASVFIFNIPLYELYKLYCTSLYLDVSFYLGFYCSLFFYNCKVFYLTGYFNFAVGDAKYSNNSRTSVST